ncbi:unnamed protein product, partial [Closterium sp. Naga37s-1]
MVQGTCTDTCIVKNCGPNATCNKDTRGVAYCVCKTGFVMVSGNCVDTCSLRTCPRYTSCSRTSSGAPTCLCNDAYQTTSTGLCIGSGTCSNCTCNNLVPYTNAPYCTCPSGYSLTTAGCVLGTGIDTLSFTSIAFYNQTNYGSTPYILRLLLGACTSLPPTMSTNFQSQYFVEMAPGGAIACRQVWMYEMANCAGRNPGGTARLFKAASLPSAL